MNISIADLLEMGYSLTPDIDGVDAEHETQVFNVGYNLFIIEFDKLYPQMRLSEKVVKSTKHGVSTNAWGTGGINDCFNLYDVMELRDPTDMTGTILFTNGSTAVTGTSSAFTSELEVGDIIFLDGEEQYGVAIASITSDGALVLESAYQGTGGSGTGKILGVEIKRVDERTSRFTLDEADSEDEKGYFKDLNKIYFPAYDSGTYFRIRYLPEIIPIDSSTPRTTQIFMPFKYRHFFAKYLAAMYAVVEEEQNLTAHAELEFEKNFEGMGRQYNVSRPIEIRPRNAFINPNHNYPS